MLTALQQLEVQPGTHPGVDYPPPFAFGDFKCGSDGLLQQLGKAEVGDFKELLFLVVHGVGLLDRISGESEDSWDILRCA